MILVLLQLLTPAYAGTIVGKVTGARPDLTTVVYVTGFEEPPASSSPLEIRQIGRRFKPDVLVVTKGQAVRFTNEDHEKHNVFSSSSARNFDLGLSDPGSGPQSITFGRTGMVDVYCNIHHEMAGAILVLPNRSFAVAAADGSYKIPGVPPGDHVVHVFHRMAKPEHRPVHVDASQETRTDWKLELSTAPTPHLDKHGRPYRDRPTYK